MESFNSNNDNLTNDNPMNWKSVETTPILLKSYDMNNDDSDGYGEFYDIVKRNSIVVNSSVDKLLWNNSFNTNIADSNMSNKISGSLRHTLSMSNMHPVLRNNIILTCQLLDQISDSIAVFRPSKSLADMNDVSDRLPPGVVVKHHAEIDIVISGGGLKGYFMAGAGRILTRELKKYKVKIARVAGASAGAWAGMFILTGVKTEDWIETYYACKEQPDKHIITVYDELWPWFKDALPSNAYQICTGKLFISLTVVNAYGALQNQMISEYYSNEDLYSCCVASSCIPYLTISSLTYRFRGNLVFDGGITNNTPIFTDGLRRQLVFRLYDVEYPFRLLVAAKDSCIDVLVLRGALLMKMFLEGEATDSIAWLEEKETKDDLNKRLIKSNYSLRLVITPFAFFGIMLYKGLRIDRIVSYIKQHTLNKEEQIIPFDNARKEFGNDQVRYIFGAIFAGFCDFLRKCNLLL